MTEEESEPGTDELTARWSMPVWMPTTITYLTFVGLAVVAVVPIIGNELRVQDVDPVFMRNLVERTAELGGSYFENSIHNRGPLEPLLYDIAGRLFPYDAFWIVISTMVVLFAAVLGWAAARTARVTGANRSVALGAAAAVYVFFTVADAGYARVLYLRNITTVLLAAVWILALSEKRWEAERQARRSSIVVGAILGFVAQQLLTTVLTGAVVGLVALALLRHRRPQEVAGHLRAAAVSAVAAFVVTPLWYIARGSFAEYWSGWWTYARYMSEGPGRSLGSQIGLGWDRFYEFHSRNPALVLLLVGFAGMTWLLWRELEPRVRILHVGLLGWFAAGWVELIISQRYSSHYYAVTAVPTAFMSAALAGHIAAAIARRRPATPLSLLVPAVATVLAIFLTSPDNFGESVKLTREFRGYNDLADERADALGGGDRSVRAVLDLVSRDQAGLLAWTLDPFVYLKNHRVPATRFQWKSFMVGEIYLGRTSEEYLLPQTWRWFAEDVEESDPVAFAETQDFASNTPFEELVRTRFRLAYPGSAAKVWLRDDVADDLLGSHATRPWRSPEPPLVGSGWTVDEGMAWFAQPSLSVAPTPLTIGAGPCTRIEGTADVAAPGVLADIRIVFSDPTDPTAEPQYLALEGARAGSGSLGLGPLGFEGLDVQLAGDGPVDLAVVVGNRSAALLVDGELRGAVRLRKGLTHIALETDSPDLTVTDVRTGDAPERGGCEARG